MGGSLVKRRMPDISHKHSHSQPSPPAAEIVASGSILRQVYERLYGRYGAQGWWPGDGPLDVIIGAILTQASAWTNVELAIANLKKAGCWSLQAIHAWPVDDLAAVIHSCGYFNAKARKLKAFAAHVMDQHGGSLASLLNKDSELLRRELLSVHGIGPETADDILVYAAGQPSFVIDHYTRRLLGRIGLMPEGPPAKYETYQALFHDNLPKDSALFNEYHALIDHHGKTTCAKKPKCSGCCLVDICATGAAFQASQNITLE